MPTIYKGRPVVFERYTSEKADGGYVLECPNGKHGGMISIDTDSGRNHKLVIDEAGLPTITGSILCRTPLPEGGECGWHVFVEKGVIRDA